MKDMPNQLEWVKERAACSVGIVFVALKTDVEKDVADRQALVPKESQYAFKFSANASSCHVSLDGFDPRLGDDVKGSVTFKRTSKGITVCDENMNTMFEATVTLGDDGRCRAKIDGKEQEFWQMRKRALERLFFDFI